MNGLLPLAFAAGMIAPVNPCGFALLPAYLATQLTESGTGTTAGRLAAGLRSGAALAAGFALTLSAAGFAISAGAHPLLTAAPKIGLAVGAALLVLAAFTLTGRGPRLRLPAAATTTTGAKTGRRDTVRWLVFGAGYAAASLSCTLGVLLAVIAQAQAAGSVTGQAGVFAAYAAGAAALLLVVSAASALAAAATGRALRVLTRHHAAISAALLAATGAYLIWYWYPAATGHAATGRTGTVAVSSSASAWIQAHQGLIAAAAALVVVSATGAAIGYRLRSHATGGTNVPIRAADEHDCCDPDDAAGQPVTVTSAREGDGTPPERTAGTRPHTGDRAH